MESAQFSAGAPAAAGTRALITRVDDLRWHAVEDDRVVGRGEATRRPDGRTSLSVDTWLGAVFDRLAAAMVAELTGPVHTLVDDADLDLVARWERAGLAVRRRERLHVVATDPQVTGLVDAAAPAGARVLPLGAPDHRLLREVLDDVRAEAGADAGGSALPAEWLPCPTGTSPVPATHAAAAGPDRYEGLVRVVRRRTHARIGLVAVRRDARRRGIARAMLAEVLGALHRDGVETASADVDTANTAATALFEGIGARSTSGVVELGRG